MIFLPESFIHPDYFSFCVNRRNEPETYGEVDPDPIDQNPVTPTEPKPKPVSKRQQPVDKDQNLLLSSDDEFQ